MSRDYLYMSSPFENWFPFLFGSVLLDLSDGANE